MEKKESEKPILSKSFILVFLLVCLIFVWFLVGVTVVNKINNKKISSVPVCGDGTFYNTCSLNKPYFCSNGTLIEKASICGCPKILKQQGNSCTSAYKTNPKSITLNYTLNGENGEIDFTVYRGMKDYLSNISRGIMSYGENQVPSRADFKIKAINEPEQREMLLPLLIKIQNMENNKQDQVRIAISLVQNIPFGGSNKTISVSNNSVNYFRYPYEVLYDMQGVCSEKTALLGFLIKEMGYGTAFFYYPLENHEAFGIKCPLKYSINNTGYCFIETTGPSVLTNDKNSYVNGVTLSEPSIFLLSLGDSLNGDMPEYKDAKFLMKTISLLHKGKISRFRVHKLDKIKKKYGLGTFK